MEKHFVPARSSLYKAPLDYTDCQYFWNFRGEFEYNLWYYGHSPIDSLDLNTIRYNNLFKCDENKVESIVTNALVPILPEEFLS